MLLRFTASNFLSLGDELEFTMFPYTRLREHKDHIHDDGKVPVLKAAAIYGANGAGKSNLVKAMNAVPALLGLYGAGQTIFHPVPFLLSGKQNDRPSSFEFEFKFGETYYAYGITYFEHQIAEEWLYQILPNTKEEQEMIVERKGDSVVFGKRYQSSREDEIRNGIVVKPLTPSLALLPILAKYPDYPEAQETMKWLTERLLLVSHEITTMATTRLVKQFQELGKFINTVLPKLDTGVLSVEMLTQPWQKVFGVSREDVKDDLVTKLKVGESIELPQSVFQMIATKNTNGEIEVSRLITTRQDKAGGVVRFEVYQESDGTQRLLDLLPVFYSAIHSDITVVIDEVGRSLHPVLLKSLIAYIMRSPMKGQLIFTTHEEHLLDLEIFRKDEIFFLDKSNDGNTKLNRLHRFNPRKDLDIKKGFTNGRFGAVPVTRKLDFENAGYVTAD
jgi:AAA15 family ATPase/GTPase